MRLFPNLGIQLRLELETTGVASAIRAYERQYCTEVRTSGPNAFVDLHIPEQGGRRYAAVPDMFFRDPALRFEWLLVGREEVASESRVGRKYATVVSVVAGPGGRPLCAFQRERGTGYFIARNLILVKLTFENEASLFDKGPTVRLTTLDCRIRPHFRISREQREEERLPREMPYGLEVMVDDWVSIGVKATKVVFDPSRVASEAVIPSAQGAFERDVSWADLNLAQRAALGKFLCGQYREDYALARNERQDRTRQPFAARDGELEWLVPADHAAWREANRDKPRWQWGSEPRVERCAAVLGLDGFPVRKPKDCGHLHFAEGVDPTHEEPQEEVGYGFRSDDDRY